MITMILLFFGGILLITIALVVATVVSKFVGPSTGHPFHDEDDVEF